MSADDTKTICFDLDGTLCTNTWGDYATAEPFPWAIARVNALAEAGHRIIVFTARGTATGIDWTDVTRGQLERWGVAYDDLRLGKPSADVYVDDRAVHTTAWREGDALAPPGFVGEAAEGAPEQLPQMLGPQRTTVVESGRTYGGRAFLADRHVDHLLTRARAAGIPDLPAPEELGQVLDRALESSTGDDGDMTFTIALAAPPTAAFLDVADEHPEGAVVTARPLEEAAQGLKPLLIDGSGDPPSIRATEHRPGGRLAAVVDGELLLAEAGPGAPPLSLFLPELAAEAGVTVADRPLTADLLERADGAFTAVSPFGLLRVGEYGGRPLGSDDSCRRRLEKSLTELVVGSAA